MFLPLIAFIITVLLIRFHNIQIWKRKHVPHQKPIPIFGNFMDAALKRKLYWNVLDDVYNMFPSARYFGFYQFSTPILVLKDPDLIKQITIKDFDHFSEHGEFIAEGVDSVWDKNLLAMKTEKWRHMRPTLSPTFTNNRMKYMYQLFLECAQSFCIYFLEQEKDVLNVELKDIFSRYTNDIVASTAFGLQCNSLKVKDDSFYIMGLKLTKFTRTGSVRFFIHRLSPLLTKLFKIKLVEDDVKYFFSKIIKDTLKLRREKGFVRKDMIELLLKAQKGNLKENNSNAEENFIEDKLPSPSTYKKNLQLPITDEDIVAQAMIFFVAGFDTASNVMSLTAYELMLNPNIQDRLINEVDSAFEKCGGTLTYEALMEMKYLAMVVSETLRKYPPFPFFDRRCVKDYVIEPKYTHERPLLIEKGTLLWLPAYSLQRDAKYFPNPDKYDPERFNEKCKSNINPYMYIPFGVGPRSCIGNRYALMEVKVVLCNLLRHFEIIPTKESPIPVEWDKNNLSFIPTNKFRMAFKRRFKQYK